MAAPRGAEKEEKRRGAGGGGGGFDIEAAVADPVAAPPLIHGGPRSVKDRLEDLLAVNDTRGINKHAWHLDRSVFHPESGDTFTLRLKFLEELFGRIILFFN